MSATRVLSALLAACLGLALAMPPGRAVLQQTEADDAALRAERAAAAIEALAGATEPPTDDEELRLLTEAYQCFLDRIERCDGPRSVRLARAMHGRAGAVWSAFCLDGSLRRAAPADAASEEARAAYAEADAVLVRLIEDPATSSTDRLAVVQRRAILAAGFDDRGREREMLGRALAAGGIDGKQITGLAALQRGDHGAAVRLFGALLDADHAPEALPWGARGHALAALEVLRARADAQR
ncbi:MAG: hypothetical protein AAGB93_19220 [Planctomycetota bacterium]